ncbi:MAG: hypothetical protein DRJ05_03825 [Bacteroidetes bacterium]|nr:MAG: hypothetical protein DRJ05_03825 [Bacteroidota bacterium]
MLLEKEIIKQVIFDNKQKEDKILENILYEILLEYNQKQVSINRETLDKQATKEDLKMMIEMMDKRFEDMYRYSDKQFEVVNKQFEAVNKRFEDMFRYMDKRFEAVDKRFDAIDKRFSFLQWFIGIAFTVISVLMAMLRIFG